MIKWPEPYLPPINLYNAPRTNDMSRKRRWLKINGKVNTLTGHMVDHGYTRKKIDVIAKQKGCKGSELTTDTLSRFFESKVEDVGQPDNWQQIMYGSKRGAQRSVPKGKKRATYAARRERQEEIYDRIDEPVKHFMAMRLSRSPAPCAVYY